MAPEQNPLTPKQKKLAAELAGLYAGVGALVTGIKPLPGLIIISCAEERATEVVKVARHYPKMLAALEKLVETNDQMQCAIGHGVMFLAILVSVDRLRMGQGLAAVLDKMGYGELVKMKLQEQGVAYGTPAAA